MEIDEQVVVSQPVSPLGEYFSSSIISLSIIAVFEFEVPLDYSRLLSVFKDSFIPINPRLSSIMVRIYMHSLPLILICILFPFGDLY